MKRKARTRRTTGVGSRWLDPRVGWRWEVFEVLRQYGERAVRVRCGGLVALVTAADLRARFEYLGGGR